MKHVIAPFLAPFLAISLLSSIAAQESGPPERLMGERLTSEQLGGAARPLVHVSTDKPIYRSGETLYARGVVLDAATHRPVGTTASGPGAATGSVAATATEWLQVEILGPKGEVVASSVAETQGSVAAFSWRVPEGQAGGLYTLRMTGNGAPGERAFEVRAFRAPRIKTQIVFLRDGYGAGDEVVATLSATRAEGGAPQGARVTLVAVVDGQEIAREPAGSVDGSGRVTARFRLPKSIERGEGTLALVIEDGGVVETASKTIPILVRSVDLSVHPEGGDLVAGLPARVYVEARAPSGKPADVAGEIVTASGEVVATFRTEHEGRGRVRLTPVSGERYRVRITEPAGIASSPLLPEVKASGGVVSAADDVTEPGKALRLRAGATDAGEYTVTVSSREREVAVRRVKIARGELRPLPILLDDEIEGVLRVTLWDDDGMPLAERLVFRRPADAVKVSIETDRPRYAPAGTVELRVRTTRGDGTPIPATVGLSVSDDSVRELLETREHPPRLPVQVLLESDVRELADATVYLDPSNPQAPRAVDLLLGTQGWRRFAFVMDPDAFVAEHGDDALRVLALREGALAKEIALSADGGEFALLDAVANMLPRRAKSMEAPRAAIVFRPPPVPQPAVAGQDMPADMPAPGMLAAAMPGEAQPVLQAQAQAQAKLEAERAQAEAMGAAFGEMQARERAKKANEAKDDRLLRDEEDMRIDADASGRRRGGKRQAAAIRVYAHAVRPGRVPGDRIDFTDTVYWNAGVTTGADGRAVVRFALSDSVTSFRVSCDAFTDGGILGAGSSLVESVEPFYLEPKMPLELTFGDIVRLPVTAVNGTTGSLPDVTLTATATGGLFAGTLPSLRLGEGERVRSLLQLKTGGTAGVADLTLTGAAAGYSDSVTRSVRIVPLGFPASRSFGGTLAPGGAVSHELDVPADLVPGSMRTEIQLFPSSLGKLTGALERLIQEPSGCFEQTSSTTYPLVMAAQYFVSHQDVDPSLVTRSQEMLAKGYERLTSFETKTHGYEWFGEAPGHEALSAFGLLEFTDMAQVRPVDAGMLERTREWILSTRDGKGGFKRERRALHAWIEDVDCSNGYILWALLEAGEDPKGLRTEIDAFAKAATASDNAYVHALAANVLQGSGRKADADAFLARLADRQAADGSVEGGTASIVGSSGEALAIETASLATLAWLRSPAHQSQVEKSIRFLSESCQGGRYGSTQSTVLALRAIVAHDELRSRPRGPGVITLRVDGKTAGEVAFDETTESVITLPDAASFLGPGRHRIELAMRDGSEMPYAIELRIHRETPESSPDCPLSLAVELASATLTEGDASEATVRLRSRSDEALPMAVAIVGLPGGLEPRHDQLKELVKGGRIAAYEVSGREVVLYFRSLPARADLRIPVSFVAAVPGTYAGPASRAYLYYGDENKTWSPGLRAEVAAR